MDRTDNRWIWFDMDGTLVDLYGVPNWLDDLINSNPRPYKEAKPLVNFSSFARVVHKLQDRGYKVGVVSWTAKNSTKEYEKVVEKTKKEYLKKHLPSVSFDSVDVIPYGTPKEKGRTGVLFDDEEQNRNNWKGQKYSEKDLMKRLWAFC